MPSLFLSYSWDDKEFVRKLRQELLKRDVSVWIDEQGLRVGDELHPTIKKAIESTDFFLVVWSPPAQRSRFVLEEIRLARRKEKRQGTRCILVVRLRPCEFPKELAFLGKRIWANFQRKGFDLALGELVVALQRHELQRSRSPRYPVAPSRVAFVEPKPSPGQQIIHIQDAPANYGAQKAVVEVLRYVKKLWGVSLILVEGGAGDVSLSYLRSYAPPEKRVEVAEKYLKAGTISAEEYLDIVSDEPLSLVGVDNRKQYDEALAAFAEAARTRKSLVDVLASVRDQLSLLKRTALSEPLLQIEELIQQFKKDSSLKCVVALANLCEQHGIDMSAPNIANFRSALDLEKRLSIEKVRQEQKDIYPQLLRTAQVTEIDDLTALASAARDGVITDSDYFRMFGDLVTTYRLWGQGHDNLRTYCRCKKLIQSFGPAGLVEEASSMATALRDALAASEQERQVLHAARVFQLCHDVVDMALTPLQYEEFVNYRSSLGLIVDFVSTQAIEEKLGLNLAHIRTLVEGAVKTIKFYELAAKRAPFIAQRTLDVMEETDQLNAVLITAGFLGEFVKRRLAALGKAVVTVFPKVVDTTDRDKYHHVVLSKAGLEQSDGLEQER